MDISRRLQHVSGCRAAHRTMLAHLGDLETSHRLEATSASLLPGWTVGHLLTHLARNADSHVQVITAALRHEVADQYPGGPEGRAAAIDAGALRSAGEQLDDLRRSIGALESAWDRAEAQGWPGVWRSPLVGERPLSELPFRRWREVEVHHADLGLAGFGVSDWSEAYVAEDLAERTQHWIRRQGDTASALPAAALALDRRRRLAWLLGRETPAGLDPVSFM